MAEGLRSAGHEVVLLAFTRLRVVAPAAQRLAELELADYEWIIVVSPSAACFAARARPGPWPAACRFAAVGPGTGEALAQAGLLAHGAEVASPAGNGHDADAMLAMPAFGTGRGRRILILAGEGGRRDWLVTLASRGFEPERLALYRREPIEPPEAGWRILADWAGAGGEPAFVVTSSDAADRLVAGLAGRGLGEWAAGRIAVCPHRRIAMRLAAAGWRDVRVPGAGRRLLDAAIESNGPHPGGAGNDERTEANRP